MFKSEFTQLSTTVRMQELMHSLVMHAVFAQLGGGGGGGDPEGKELRGEAGTWW